MNHRVVPRVKAARGDVSSSSQAGTVIGSHPRPAVEQQGLGSERPGAREQCLAFCFLFRSRDRFYFGSELSLERERAVEALGA